VLAAPFADVARPPAFPLPPKSPKSSFSKAPPFWLLAPASPTFPAVACSASEVGATAASGSAGLAAYADCVKAMIALRSRGALAAPPLPHKPPPAASLPTPVEVEHKRPSPLSAPPLSPPSALPPSTG
jgi:hypothetical protein